MILCKVLDLSSFNGDVGRVDNVLQELRKRLERQTDLEFRSGDLFKRTLFNQVRVGLADWFDSEFTSVIERNVTDFAILRFYFRD